MINLDSITLENINQRLESMDPKIREVMESELFTDRVSEISNFYNFDLTDRENLAFHKLVAVTILGFIQPTELPEAILTFIETDKETAEEATNEVKKVIAPLVPSLKTPEQIRPVVEAATTDQQPTQQPQNAPAPLPPTTEAPTEVPIRPDSSGPIKPKPVEPIEPKPNIEPAQQPPQAQQKPEQEKQQPHLTKAPKPDQSAAPFVIHEDVEVKPTTEQNVEEQNPTRPIFYKPSFSQENKPESSPTKVKVDLGNEESLNPQAAPKRKDYTIHTPKAQSEEEVNGPVSSSEVHPENIVDLKDLPR